MLEGFVKKIVKRLLFYHLISKDAIDEYEYVLLNQIETFITYLTIFSIAVVSGYLLESVGFFIMFFTLRKRTGGFHLKSFLECYVGTIGIYCLLLYMNVQFAVPKMVFYVLTFFSSCIVALIGAVNHPNIQWSKEEQKDSAACARWILCMELFVIIFICILDTDRDLEQFLMSGIILCAFLMLLAKIKKQEVGLK